MRMMLFPGNYNVIRICPRNEPADFQRGTIFYFIYACTSKTCLHLSDQISINIMLSISSLQGSCCFLILCLQCLVCCLCHWLFFYFHLQWSAYVEHCVTKVDALIILCALSQPTLFGLGYFSFCTSNTLIIIYQKLLSLDLVNSPALTRSRKTDLRNFGSCPFLKYLKERFKVHLSRHRVSGVQKLKTKMSGGNAICIFYRQFSLLHQRGTQFHSWLMKRVPCGSHWSS